MPSSDSGMSSGARSVVTGEILPSGVAATAVKRTPPFARPPCGTSVSFSKGILNSSGTSHIFPDFFGVPMCSEARSGLTTCGMWTPESTASATFCSRCPLDDGPARPHAHARASGRRP